MVSIEQIREIFSGDKYLVSTGVLIEAADRDYSLCSIIGNVGHMNAAGTVQGGAIYTLADSAFAVAANYSHIDGGDDSITISLSASISYLAAAHKGEKLTAVCRKVGGGKRTPVYNIDVKGEDERIVATMTANGYTVKKK